MKRQFLKGSSVVFVVILLSLMTGVALAEKKHWFVVKDRDGVCKVIEAESVAGPFKTMRQAEKRKAKVCPRGAGQATEQLRHQQDQSEHVRPQQEQAEPIRRQHRQREERQQQHLKQQQTPQQQHQQQVEPARRQPLQREGAQQQHLKQPQAPQQDQQAEKIKGKVQEKIEGAKSPAEKGKEKAKEPIPSERKN